MIRTLSFIANREVTIFVNSVLFRCPPNSERVTGYSGNNSLARVLPLFLRARPRGAAALDGWREMVLRADSIENSSCSLLDVLQALRQ